MGTLGGEASAEVDAPIDRVWAVVEDVVSSPQWQDGLDGMEPLEHDADGRVVLADSIIDTKVRRVTTRVRFTYDPPHRVSWTQVKGDLKSLDGAWELEDAGGGRTRATYRLEGDAGRVLGMLVRGPVQDRLRRVVEGRPEELRARLRSG